MRKLLLAILIIIGFLLTLKIGSAQFAEIGKVTSENAIRWDKPIGSVDGYNIYLAPTNQTTFLKAATVSTNQWNGDQTKTLSGWRVMYVTAIFGADESDPSEKVLVQFRAGVPLPPSNISIMMLLQTAATNALPLFGPTAPTPPP